MAKMKKEDVEKIVERDMPGYRVSRKPKPGSATDTARSRPVSEARTPDLETLKRKYLKKDPAKHGSTDARHASAADAASGGVENEDEIVPVEREARSHPWDRASRPKAVVVSGKEKRIVGKQG